MNKKLISTLAIITYTFVLVFSIAPAQKASAAIADGTYSVSYEVLQGNNNSASIANGYFLKPATLIVEGGTQYIQLTMKDSHMVKSLSGPYGSAQVISDDKANNKRTVKFKVDDISNPATVSMHVVVDTEEVKYDTNHKARLKFGSPSGAATSKSTTSTAKASSDNAGAVDNPKTSDKTPILLFSLLLIGSGLIVARRFTTK